MTGTALPLLLPLREAFRSKPARNIGDVPRNYGLKNLNYLIPERQTDYGQEAMKVGSFEAGRRDIFFNRKKQN
jgi:hypothetical protein